MKNVKVRLTTLIMLLFLSFIVGCNQNDENNERAEIKQQADSQNYPNQLVTLLVPFPPGGGTDSLARYLANELAESWGVNVIVKNLTGASGRLAEQHLLKAAHDGYTIYLNNSSYVTSPPILSPKTPKVKGLKGVVQIARSSSLFIVPKDSPFNEMKSLVTDAKREHKFIGSCGVGTPQHWGTILLNERHGDYFKHVAYGGCSDALLDVVRGEIDGALVTESSALAMIKSGDVKLFGITASSPSPWLPEAPLNESWLSDQLSLDQWYGLFVPDDLDPNIIEKIENSVMKIMKTEKSQAMLYRLGLTVSLEGMESFNQRIEEEQNQFIMLEEKQRD